MEEGEAVREGFSMFALNKKKKFSFTEADKTKLGKRVCSNEKQLLSNVPHSVWILLHTLTNICI